MHRQSCRQGLQAYLGRSLSSHATQTVDVAVVGAGMVGAALAAALGAHPKTQHLSVAVLDRQAPPKVSMVQLPSVPAARVSTLTPASIKLLQQTGAWPDVMQPRSAAFGTMQVWDASGMGFIRWDAAEAGVEVMGHVVENAVLQDALLRRVRRQPCAQTLWSASVDSLQLPPYPTPSAPGDMHSQGMPFAQLQLAGGGMVRARLVVGADGARSHIRSLAALRTLQYSYRQRGVVATLRTVPGHATAWQRFLPSGPLALLPVRDGWSNIVWSTSPQHARQLENSSPDELVHAVNQALLSGRQPSARGTLSALLGGQAGGGFELPPTVTEAAEEPAKSFPLHLCQAGRYVRPRLALIGDAAHAVHPLAGQGVNLGLADVACLVEALGSAVETGTDLGDLQMLEAQYERPRQRANQQMALALDTIGRAFSPQNALVAGIRGMGLDFINAVPPVRRQIMQYAMG